MTEEKDYITLRIPKYNKTQVFITLFLIVASFALGSFWTKMKYLEKVRTLESSNTALAAKNPSGNTAQAPQAAPTEDTTPKKVSVDDDPVLGNENAKVTLIEFSDYECPFCKRHFDQTFSQLKKEYIDTGKVKLVFRDLPLPFHDPMATTEAIAANCAREQGDDSTYYKYHDEIFKRTKSNGNGLSVDDLYTISTDLGLSVDVLKTCVDSGKYKEEVSKDLADSSTVGANSTPTFFIGKSSTDGVITGTKIVGAQPYSTFKAEIDKQLK